MFGDRDLSAVTSGDATSGDARQQHVDEALHALAALSRKDEVGGCLQLGRSAANGRGQATSPEEIDVVFLVSDGHNLVSAKAKVRKGVGETAALVDARRQHQYSVAAADDLKVVAAKCDDHLHAPRILHRGRHDRSPYEQLLAGQLLRKVGKEALIDGRREQSLLASCRTDGYSSVLQYDHIKQIEDATDLFDVIEPPTGNQDQPEAGCAQ